MDLLALYKLTIIMIVTDCVQVIDDTSCLFATDLSFVPSENVIEQLDVLPTLKI